MNPTPAQSPESFGAPGLPAEVLEAVVRGNKIEAIKLLRAARGLGLKEAKDIVDAAEPGIRAAHPSLAPGEMAQGGSASVWRWIVGLAVVAVAAYLVLRLKS